VKIKLMFCTQFVCDQSVAAGDSYQRNALLAAIKKLLEANQSLYLIYRNYRQEND
jgi:hypothetical protein